MDEMNASQSFSPSTSAVATQVVFNNTNEQSCIDIEVDVELNPVQSVGSPYPSRASISFDGFDAGDSVSAQDFDGEEYVFAHGFDVEDTVSAQLSPLLPFYPTENSVPPRISLQRTNWPRIVKVLVGVMIIIVTVGLIATFFFMTKRVKTSLECKIKYTVSKDGTSNFTTVSEAVKASPSHSKHKVCILIKAGDYHEIVRIDKEKINLVLIGEGIGKTTITSTKSIEGSVSTWSPATLSIDGKGFLAQDLTIVNTAKYGGAVENWAEYSVFFRCKLEGANATLYIKGVKQFYRDCQLYGRNNLVFGDARAFFQKCEFLIEKSYTEQKLVFSSQSSHYLAYREGLVFHLCAFSVDKFLGPSEKVFLGSSLGRSAFFVVMQSYLDASIGGYFIGTASPTTTYCAIFGNLGRGANMANMPPFVHVLRDVESASQFSLRVFLGGENWIAPWVDFDLDLLK